MNSFKAKRLFAMGLAILSDPLWAGCEHPVARLVAAQGEVRGQESGRSDWHAAIAN